MKLAVVCLSAVLLAACASSNSGDVYSRDQAKREMHVRTGVVESVRAVMIEGTRSGIGAGAGAIVGGVVGRGAAGGNDRGQIVGSVLGAVVGGLAGAALEEGGTRKPAVEITVRPDQGSGLIVVVQEGSPEDFRPGEAVRVVSGAGDTRVSR